MGNYTILYMFENPRRGRRARNFTTNVPKILVLKWSSEQIFSRKLPLGAPESLLSHWLAATQSCDSQTWYTFFCSNSSQFYTYTPDILTCICNCVYQVHGLWMSWQFPLFFFEFADQPIIKTLKPPLQVLKNRQGTPNFWHRASFTRAETTSRR